MQHFYTAKTVPIENFRLSSATCCEYQMFNFNINIFIFFWLNDDLTYICLLLFHSSRYVFFLLIKYWLIFFSFDYVKRVLIQNPNPPFVKKRRVGYEKRFYFIRLNLNEIFKNGYKPNLCLETIFCAEVRIQ